MKDILPGGPIAEIEAQMRPAIHLQPVLLG
jgi:hypothetical protein